MKSIEACRSLCKCGCGCRVKFGNRFVHGHNRHGLASYTSNGKWSMIYDSCIKCGTKRIKHVGYGYCSNCFRKLQRSGVLKKGPRTLDKWSREYDVCIDCNTTKRPHRANGFCDRCYVNSLNRAKGVPEKKCWWVVLVL